MSPSSPTQHSKGPADRPEAVEILYQDRRLVAVSKPSGLFVHRSALAPDRDVLVGRLRAQLGCGVYGVHRIDRATSGVVLFGLDSEAARLLQAALSAPEARKTYLGLARGFFPERLLVDRLLTDRERGVRQSSRTAFRRLGVVAERNSLVAAMPVTGRRHQIRRHLARLGHQLIGDTTYGKGRINRYFRETYGLHRLALHAWRIEIEDPFSGERRRIEAPLPPDLLEPLSRMPGFSPALVGALDDLPRYSPRPFPAYRHLPGRTPHPRRHPDGHSQGRSEPTAASISEQNWHDADLYLHGVDLFNRGYWWESHEVFEALWLAVGRSTRQGSLLKGLIQIAAAQIHRLTDGRGGGTSLARKALERLEAIEGVCLGVDVAAVAAEARAHLLVDGSGSGWVRIDLGVVDRPER